MVKGMGGNYGPLDYFGVPLGYGRPSHKAQPSEDIKRGGKSKSLVIIT